MKTKIRIISLIMGMLSTGAFAQSQQNLGLVSDSLAGVLLIQKEKGCIQYDIVKSDLQIKNGESHLRTLMNVTLKSSVSAIFVRQGFIYLYLNDISNGRGYESSDEIDDGPEDLFPIKITEKIQSLLNKGDLFTITNMLGITYYNKSGVICSHMDYNKFEKYVRDG